ncbi:MAG: hypothetical protein ABI977_04935 [Acidobacteriota bacterium]
MNRIFPKLFLLTILSVCFVAPGWAQSVSQVKPGLAQNAAAVAPKASVPVEPAKPLTIDQKQKLGEAQTQLQLARANFEAARAQLQNQQTYVDGLVLQFALELGVDPNKYDVSVKLIDEKAGVIGFTPKSPPSAPSKP